MADGGQILLSEGVYTKLVENLPPLKDLDIELKELGTYDTPAVGQMELWEIRSTQLSERTFVLNSSPSQPPTPMADRRQLATQGSVGDVATLLELMKPYADKPCGRNGQDLGIIPERRSHQSPAHSSEQSSVSLAVSVGSMDHQAPPCTPYDSLAPSPVVLTPGSSHTAILEDVECGTSDPGTAHTRESGKHKPLLASKLNAQSGGAHAKESASQRLSPRTARSQFAATSNKSCNGDLELSPSASPPRSLRSSTKQIPEELVLASRKSLKKSSAVKGSPKSPKQRKKAPPPIPIQHQKPSQKPTVDRPTQKSVSGKPTQKLAPRSPRGTPPVTPRPDSGGSQKSDKGTTNTMESDTSIRQQQPPPQPKVKPQIHPKPPPPERIRTPTKIEIPAHPPTPKKAVKSAPTQTPTAKARSQTSTPSTPSKPTSDTTITPTPAQKCTTESLTPPISDTQTPSRSKLNVRTSVPLQGANTLTQTPKIKTPIARAESIAKSSRSASTRVCVHCDRPVSYGSGDWLQIGESAYHRDHFRCRECKSHLSDLPFIMGDDGHVYCVSDYAKKFGDVCKVCDTPILPSETTVKGGEFSYHVEHFRCVHCNLSLVNQSFIQKYDNIYCLADFYNIIADKCEKCNTPVQDSDFIDAMGSSWHVACFVCHRCKASPDCEEGMYEHDGSPYCHKCYKDVRTEVYEKTGVELP